ncbi:MAG: CPBP family intramembrane metalloprotease [Alkalibacterium sp.]|nr:CPBP family intramembrane metalloprotease [Alkalibacterium sp.]
MSTYESTFEKASIWAILWRTLLISIGVVILGVVLIFAFMGEHSTLIGLVTDGLVYFTMYKLTLRQMKKHSLSVRALSRPLSQSNRSFLPVLGLTILTAVVAYSFIYFFMTLLTFIPALFDLIMPYLINISFVEDLPFIYLFVVAVIFAPIVEEIVFRGYILNKWVDKYGVKKGIIFSSLVFMIIHLQSLFIPQLIVGILCGLLYVKFNNLVYPILFHAVYNFIVLIPTFFINYGAPEEAQEALLSIQESLPMEFILVSLLFLVSLPLLVYVSKRFFHTLRETGSPYAQNIELVE